MRLFLLFFGMFRSGLFPQLSIEYKQVKLYSSIVKLFQQILSNFELTIKMREKNIIQRCMAHETQIYLLTFAQRFSLMEKGDNGIWLIQINLLSVLMGEEKANVQINVQEDSQFSFSVEEFRNTNSNSIQYFEFPIQYKEVYENYIVYRGKGWQQHKALKTLIKMPGTAFVNFNTVNADVIYPGLLSHLPSDTQIIIAIYPNAPENKFPTPIVHLQRTISDLLEEPQKYLIDESNVILGGYSCGASMAVPLALYFAKRSLFFKSLLLVSPIFDYSGSLFKDQELTRLWGPLEKRDHKKMNSEFIDFANGIYSHSPSDLVDPFYSPIFTPLSQLKQLRNPCFIYGEYDFMRRTIEAFKGRLAQAKVKSESILLEGEGHRSLVMVRQSDVVLAPELQEKIREKKTQNFRQISRYIRYVFA